MTCQNAKPPSKSAPKATATKKPAAKAAPAKAATTKKAAAPKKALAGKPKASTTKKTASTTKRGAAKKVCLLSSRCMLYSDRGPLLLARSGGDRYDASSQGEGRCDQEGSCKEGSRGQGLDCEQEGVYCQNAVMLRRLRSVAQAPAKPRSKTASKPASKAKPASKKVGCYDFIAWVCTDDM